MRGLSVKNHEANEKGIMELDKLSKIQQVPPGAYIRSLVKQLTTSTRTTKDSMMNPKERDCVMDGHVLPLPPARNLTRHGKVVDAGQLQQRKKQVRRRVPSCRRYQERILNMAEARKEIVTALKFHRAAMKQASERRQLQQQQQEEQQQPIPPVSLQPTQVSSLEQDEGRFKSRRNPRIYTSCTTNFSNFMDEFSCSYSPQVQTLVPDSYAWPNSSAPPPLLAENPNFILPNQPLGLNLNFHDFNNLDATLHLNNSSLSSYSSPTSSSPPLSAVTDQEIPLAPPLSVVTDQEIPLAGYSQGEGSSSLVDCTVQSGVVTHPNGDLHTAVDDEGMAEIRYLGEKHQMEWNDTMNLVKSACWSKFLKNMEHEAPEAKSTEDYAYHVFNDVVEFPSWLNANGSCLEQCPENDFQDSSLPCMDIGDIESMDQDWLA